MRESLLIRLARGGGDVDWAVLGASGRLEGGIHHGPPGEAAAAGQGRQVVVLVPSEDILLTAVQIPTQSRQKVLRAVPYALEEQLAADVDTLHFALGGRDPEHGYRVAVVARNLMDGWLAGLHEAGLEPDILVPDVLAVPLLENEWSLLVEPDGALMRSGPGKGYFTERDNLELMLELLAQGEEVPEVVRVFPCDEIVIPMRPGLNLIYDNCEGGALALLGRGVGQGGVINLLQGAYSRREQLGALWRPWRASAALLLIGLVLLGVQKGMRYYQLQAEQERLAAAIERIYRETFPDARKIVNPRAQMEQRLTALRRQTGQADVDFLAMLAQAGTVLKSNQQIRINGLSFRDGRLDLDLVVPSVQALDQLKQQLTAAGDLAVEIQSATTGSDSKVSSRLRIESKRS